jgi:hypothetical protein
MTGAPLRSQSACHRENPQRDEGIPGHRLAPHGIASLARNDVIEIKQISGSGCQEAHPAAHWCYSPIRWRSTPRPCSSAR